MDTIDILKIHGDDREKRTENISEEVPLTVKVNANELATLLCSPNKSAGTMPSTRS